MCDILVVILGGTAVDVNYARRNLSGLRVLKIGKIKRRDIAVGVNVYHTACLAFAEELVNAHCEFSAVSQVVSDRILATHVISDFERTALDFQAESLELLVKKVVEKHCLGEFAEFRVTVVIVGEMYSGILELLDVKVVEETFGSNDAAVFDAHNLPLDDG